MREVAVAANGDLYAAVSGEGGGVRAYRDTSGDGRPDEEASFGPGGGNDVALHQGHLYFALNDRIVRRDLFERRAPQATAGREE